MSARLNVILNNGKKFSIKFHHNFSNLKPPKWGILYLLVFSHILYVHDDCINNDFKIRQLISSRQNKEEETVGNVVQRKHYIIPRAAVRDSNNYYRPATLFVGQMSIARPRSLRVYMIVIYASNREIIVHCLFLLYNSRCL